MFRICLPLPERRRCAGASTSTQAGDLAHASVGMCAVPRSHLQPRGLELGEALAEGEEAVHARLHTAQGAASVGLLKLGFRVCAGSKLRFPLDSSCAVCARSEPQGGPKQMCAQLHTSDCIPLRRLGSMHSRARRVEAQSRRAEGRYRR